MELSEAVRARRMVRSFAPRPVLPGVVAELLQDALRAPSAGNTRGTAWVVLEGAAQTARYWDATTTPSWRGTSERWPGLSRAPIVAVSLTSPAEYVRRYGEEDKHGSGLGDSAAAWPVPYWFGDAAFGVMTLLLGATGAGLGACFLGSFRGEQALLAELGVPDGWLVFGAVLLGYPDGGDHRSASLDRGAPPAEARLHYGGWSSPPSAAATSPGGASGGGQPTERQ